MKLPAIKEKLHTKAQKLAPTWQGMVTRIVFVLLILIIMAYLRAEQLHQEFKNMSGWA